jgi:hypothetical protein
MLAVLCIAAEAIVPGSSAVSCSDNTSGVSKDNVAQLLQIMNFTYQVCDAIFGAKIFGLSVEDSFNGNDTNLLKLICNPDPHPPTSDLQHPETNVCAQYFGLWYTQPAWKECAPAVRAQDINYNLSHEILKCNNSLTQQDQHVLHV